MSLHEMTNLQYKGDSSPSSDSPGGSGTATPTNSGEQLKINIPPPTHSQPGEKREKEK